MEPWKTKHKEDIKKYIIGNNLVYKIRLDTILLKMINKTVKISKTPQNLHKTTLHKNFTKHYFEIYRIGNSSYVSI